MATLPRPLRHALASSPRDRDRRSRRARNQATPTYWPSTAAVVEDGVMDGYTNSTYGDAFADVYDEWYHDISDIGATVDLLTGLAAEFGDLPVLELGVGTGRLAVPLAARG